MKKIKKILTEFVEVTIGITVLWTVTILCLSVGTIIGLCPSIGIEHFINLFF